MKKNDLERFITKYNLGGIVESVMWTAENGGLSTRFISDDKHVVGEVSTNNLALDDGEYAIFETNTLARLLGVLGDDVTIKVNQTNGKDTSLGISDGETKVTFVLANKSNIPGAPALKNTPDFDVSIKLDNDFVNKFIKAKSALPDVVTFTALTNGKHVDVVLGYSSVNTNRVTLKPDATFTAKLEPIQFHAEYFKNILSANWKDAKGGTLEISSAGLARIKFDIPDFLVVYYLPKVEVED